MSVVNVNAATTPKHGAANKTAEIARQIGHPRFAPMAVDARAAIRWLRLTVGVVNDRHGARNGGANKMRANADLVHSGLVRATCLRTEEWRRRGPGQERHEPKNRVAVGLLAVAAVVVETLPSNSRICSEAEEMVAAAEVGDLTNTACAPWQILNPRAAPFNRDMAANREDAISADG